MSTIFPSRSGSRIVASSRAVRDIPLYGTLLNAILSEIED
jgi:hypothetical protein